MAKLPSDITIIFYTANFAPESFTDKIIQNLIDVKGDIPIVSVSQKPMNLGENICVGEIGRSHLNIYRQALVGAKVAKTKYIAFCEDDTLYSPKHFEYRPKSGVFAYNKSCWSIYTWKPDIYSYKDRRTLNNLICERELFIEAMEERFAKYDTDSEELTKIWAEPGKYENHLGVSRRESEVFFSDPPNIAFSHEKALAFLHLGRRKKLGFIKALEIPYWGKAKDLSKIYEL